MLRMMDTVPTEGLANVRRLLEVCICARMELTDMCMYRQYTFTHVLAVHANIDNTSGYFHVLYCKCRSSLSGFASYLPTSERP